MGRLGTPESIRKRYYETISADKIMQDNFDLAQLLSEKYDEIHYYYGSGYSNQTSINKEMLESYIERWKEINRVRKIGLQEMQEKLQQLRMQQHDLSGLSIAKLLASQRCTKPCCGPRWTTSATDVSCRARRKRPTSSRRSSSARTARCPSRYCCADTPTPVLRRTDELM